MKCPDCDHAYIPGQMICEECGSDLSPIEVPPVVVDKVPEYYCDPNQTMDNIKGCGYVGAMAGHVCPACGNIWEHPLSASAPLPPIVLNPKWVIEGNQTVLYEGRAVSEIMFDSDELSVGCRDTEQGHYPDIDLFTYRAHDPSLSRKHALLFKEDKKYFITVLSQAESTGLNTKTDIIVSGNPRELKIGDRIFFSDAIVMTLTDG